MSISSRITSIEEHIGNAYNKLEDLGIDSTGIDKNIDNIAEMLDTVYQDYPKVTGTGTEVTLDGTKVGKLGLDVKGNSTQEGTPSPTNEVPIYSAGDNGTISEKIVNKNLFDKNTVLRDKTFTSQDVVSTSTGLYVSDYIKVKPSTSYYVNENCPVVIGLDKNKSPLGYIKNTSVAGTITTPNNCEWIRVRLYNTSIAMETAISNAMVNLGSTATTYVAHQEQTYTIPVQQPMRSIGTVRDEFIQINGEWKERHNIKRYRITGNEITVAAGVSFATMYSNGYIGRYITMDDMLVTSVRNDILCNCFPTVSTSLWAPTQIGAQTFSNQNRFIISVTVEELETYSGQTLTVNNYASIYISYLANLGVYIDYLLATPTDLPCTQEQISILENLPKSYNEQTNIYSLDVTPAYIEAQALKGE